MSGQITELTLERGYIRSVLRPENGAPLYSYAKALESELARVRLLLRALRDGTDTPDVNCEPLGTMSSHRYLVDQALKI